MYKKMMVPLDGSELAECVLPHAKAFIKGFNLGDVFLVRVVEPEMPSYRDRDSINPQAIAQRESSRKSSAKDYLNQVANGLKHEGTALHVEVILGRVTESLIDCVKQNDIDLILIATHGRSGVTRWVRGSVADKILRSSTIPVFMIRAPGTEGGI